MNRYGFIKTSAELIGVASVLAATFVASAQNLVVDPEFSANGFGGYLNWSCGHEIAERAAIRLPKAGPDRSDAVRLQGFHEKGSFAQTGFQLVTGEPYRISVWTRTKGLPQGAARWVIWGAGWKGPECSVAFPTNTNGRWTQIEATCQAMPAANPGLMHYLSVHFKTDMPADATIEIARPEVIPLSEKGQKESKPPTRNVRREHFRVVPIDPKLSEVDPDAGVMTFYYGGELPGLFEDYEIRASVDGVFRGSALMDSTRRCTVRMGRLAPGDHSLTVNLIRRKDNRRLSRDVYQVRALKPEVFDVGRPLNNLVTELLAASASDGDVTFVNPRDGWVFIGLTDAGDAAEGFLDGDAVPVVRKRDGEPLQTMRYLRAGRHVLTLRGVRGGKLTVRAIKPLVCRSNDPCSDFRTHHYGESFYRRFVLPWYNTVQNWMDPATTVRFDPANDAAAMSHAERGMRIAGAAHLKPADGRRGDVDEIIKVIRSERWGWVSGRDIFFDENCVLGNHDHHENFAEALWRSYTAAQAFYVCYADGWRFPFLEPRVHANEISSIINSGAGRGCIALEAYPHAFADKKEADAQIDKFLEFAKSIEAIVPAAKNSVEYHFCYWLQPSQNGFNAWNSADADLRVLTDDMFRRVAVDPAFKDTVWGVGFGAFFTTDEEMVRWMMRLVRHYAVEGRTDSVSESLGYKYNPGYVRNGDLETGLEGWDLDAAEPDSLKRIVIDRYAQRGQGRRYTKGDVGNALALFVRQSNRANRMSQKISGLVPGRRYALVYISQDYDQYLKTPGAQGKEYAFRVDFNGATNEPALETACGGLDYKLKDPNYYYVYRHRLVFRAQSPEVTITFLDRAPGEAEGVTTRLGQRRMINFIHVHDYFEGDEQDVEDMLKLR